ncbi:MAG TPA: 2'-5' RNA ligase family protein [Pseudonocardiaceae bacterium]|jgi:2'-5' RNA ligase|nr:2'-5' RNA ligase family protein [Pseudonocardiaceae bacterium]
MPRLFSALRPPRDALDHLAARLTGLLDAFDATHADRAAADLRRSPQEGWHVTLGFYGEDDLDTRRDWLRPRLSGLRAPRLRLAGAGTFAGVLWAGVRPDGPADAAALTELAVAAGAEPEEYVPHLSLARWRRRHEPAAHGRDPVDVRGLTALLTDYTGPWFLPTEAYLMRSESVPNGHRYHVEDRLSLIAGATPEQG